MKELPNLRQTVEELMVKDRLTLKEVAHRIELTELSFRKILNRNDCKVKTLFQIADALGVSILELVLDKKELAAINHARNQLAHGNSESLVTDLANARNQIKLLEELLQSRNELIEELKKKEA
jgi:transcriptional regulator with XRE-family HTH domain